MEQWVNPVYLWLLQAPALARWVGGVFFAIFLAIACLLYFVGRMLGQRKSRSQKGSPRGPRASGDPSLDAGISQQESLEGLRLLILLSDLPKKLTQSQHFEDIGRELLSQVKKLFPDLHQVGFFVPSQGSELSGENTLVLRLGGGIEGGSLKPINRGEGLIGLAAEHNLILWRTTFEDRFGRQKAMRDEEAGYFLADVAVPIVLKQVLFGVLAIKGGMSGGLKTFADDERALAIVANVAAVSFGYAENVIALNQSNQHMSRIANELAQMNQTLQMRVDRKVSELRHAEHQLLQVEQLALFGEFVASVAHDIKTPMAFISGECQWALEIAKEKGNDNNSLIASLEVIQKNSQRLQTDIKSLLSRVKIPDLNKEPYSMAKVIAEVLEMAAHSAQSKGIIIQSNHEHWRSTPTSPLTTDVLDCYPGLLRHALTNLVSNAIDAMHGKGLLKVNLTANPSHMLIEVSDNGSGISPTDLPKLFELFHTKKAGGLGIGLTSVKRIVEKNHRGKITVQSQPNVETRFTIFLPRHDADESDYQSPERSGVDQ